MRAALACLLLCACGGRVDPDESAEPLPSEFPFQYVGLQLFGGGVLDEGDPASYAAGFDATDERSGLFPVQYGIGYFYPATGDLEVELSDCTAQESGFYDLACTARLTALTLTVTSRADYPDAFMDEATFALGQPAAGEAQRWVQDDTYELAVEALTLRAETRTGASSSEYQGGLRATLGGTVMLTAHLAK